MLKISYHQPYSLLSLAVSGIFDSFDDHESLCKFPILQFLLVWMNHSRTLNSRRNRLHERSLCIVYKDKKSSFQHLLIKDNSVTIHHRNIQYLSIELYKEKNGLSPPIMNLVFPTIQPVYNLTSNN